MEVLGNLDFLGRGKLIRPVLAAADFPTDPSVGELLFKDKKLYVCIEVQNGLPFWVPLTNEINTYKHSQTSAALEWTISHNFNSNIGIVQVYDQAGKQIIPDEIDASVQNMVTIKFSEPTTGIALFMLGESVGTPKQNPAYVADFSNQAVWVVNHNLGYNPNITAIVDNYVVQPVSIEHNSVLQATVTFSTARTGSVRCV